MARRGPNRTANIWTARIIPVFLLGIIVYSSWVVTKKVCIDYLLQPNPSTILKPRPGVATAILVIYYVLLIPMLTCYARLIHTIISNPGFVPRSAAWLARKAESNTKAGHGHKSRCRRSRRTLSSTTEKESTSQSSGSPSPTHSDNSAPLFWQRDVFVSHSDGRPPFCSTCLNWKPDRTHHCSEVGRCVRKMDHFCPWVGGIISETSFKFFIQFLFYSALFCTHTLVFAAYFLAERTRKEETLDVHWVLLVAFAGLFGLFSIGMCSSSIQFAGWNVTTIENFDRTSKVWYLCVFLPRSDETLRRLQRQGRGVRTIPYPRPPEENANLLQTALGEGQEASAEQNVRATEQLSANEQTRLFAILELPPGANPWDRGIFANIQEVLGYTALEWLLPVKRSPCAIHDDQESMFKLGPAVEKAKREAGLVEGGDDEKERTGHHNRRHRRHRHRRRSRRKSGSGSGSGSGLETGETP